MKHILRAAAWILAASLLLPTAGAAFLGQPLRCASIPLSDGLTLAETTWRTYDAAHLRREKVLTYTPGGAVTPCTVYGFTLFGRSTMDTVEKYPDAWGLTVAAGVNGSFFDFASGIPYGCVITGGCVRTSGTLESVGFKADGSAIIGLPKLDIALTLPTGTVLRAVNCNKVLTAENGVMLYTRDYDHATKNTIPAHNVILRPDQPDLKLNSLIHATVEEVVPDTASCEIPEGCFVLSMAENTQYEATLETCVKPLAVGQELSIGVTVGDGWGDVVSACAGMELLVQNGVAAEKFSLSSANTLTSRSAIGVTADGRVMVLTVDHSDGSTGMTLAQTAQRMLELGCVTALNLDGGGSTAIRVHLPGKSAPETRNTPSDGALRKCANFIFFTYPRSEAGDAAGLFAYPYDACALPGGVVPLTVTAVDKAYAPVPLPGDVLCSAEGGAMNGTDFLAQLPGTASVSLRSGGVTGTVTVTVLEEPDSVTVSRERDGMPPEATILTGQELALTAAARYAGGPVYASDESFSWSCDSAIGAIDASGLFHAAAVEEETAGTITCSVGSVTKTISITVLPEPCPFEDMKGHWAKAPVLAMYEAGVLQGSARDGVLYFRPDDPMTRQEFITALMRRLDAAVSEAPAPPFDDLAEISDWALPRISAAYAAGLLTGSAQGGLLLCNPGQSITRQEAMTILSRALTGSEPPPIREEAPELLFSDWAQTADWARDPLSRMIRCGAVEGSGGSLRPLSPITRAQTAKLLAELF